MEAKEPTGPPELPKGTTPQLVRSTKSTLSGVEPEEDFDDTDPLNEHIEEPGDPDGVHAADLERIWQEQHAEEATEPIVGRKKRRWPLLVTLFVVVLVCAAGAYWFGVRKAAAPAPKKTGTTPASQKQPTHEAVTPTKHYDSVTYTLGFDYPETWTVSDTSARLSTTSPAVSLTRVDGTAMQAHVVVTIQNHQTTIAGFPASGAVAALISDKLTYKQPTAVQRAQTYLSYLSYGKANGLDALYITGDTGYQQGQQVPMSDVAKGNPLVSVSFVTCPANDCSSGTPAPLTVLASKWPGTSISKQVVTLLQSMQLN